jgi:hypothetical protein
MMERPKPDDADALPPDPAPASDPEPTPRFPKKSPANHDARPETLASNMKVTPLDDSEAIADDDGIEVNET